MLYVTDSKNEISFFCRLSTPIVLRRSIEVSCKTIDFSMEPLENKCRKIRLEGEAGSGILLIRSVERIFIDESVLISDETS